MEEDQFHTIKPLNELLKPYISYYYFHQSFDDNFEKSFHFFPNYKHAITIYENSEADIISQNINPQNGNDRPTILFTMNYKENVKVNLYGKINKIGIVFNPLGINHFIDGNLNKIIHELSVSFHQFGDSFDKVLKQVFATNDLTQKRDLLDNYLIQKWKPFNFPILKQIINDIHQSNGCIKIEELANNHSINRKTILRLFQTHLNCSPEVYKKMIKFRNTLNFSLSNPEEISLTDISLYNLYYDQADFNKNFKSITKLKPKELLSKITHLGEEDTYWYFE